MIGDLVPMSSAEFKLSITRALADQLAEALSGLRPAPLTAEELGLLQPRPGVYELFHHGDRVYVGKASTSLPTRLGNHLRKLSGRTGLALADIAFQCLYVDEDLEAAAPEKMLIKKYKSGATDGAPWNANGFGNRDPGRNRDHSLVKANHFDALYPINLDHQIGSIDARRYPLRRYLTAVKAALPFNLRFETKTTQSSEDYRASTVEIPEGGPMTARRLIGLAIEALPEGWQATALPGYVILYHEDSAYESARLVWRKRGGLVEEVAGPARLDSPGEVEDDPEAEG